MARGVDFKGSNTVFHAPEGADNVLDLHVFATPNMVVSCWELTPEELEEVQRTGRIFLSVLCGDGKGEHTLFPSLVASETEMRSFVADEGSLWPR